MNRASRTLAAAATTAVALLTLQASTIRAQTSSPAPAQKKYQTKPPATQQFGAKAFEASDRTTIRWTGNAARHER